MEQLRIPCILMQTPSNSMAVLQLMEEVLVERDEPPGPQRKTLGDSPCQTGLQELFLPWTLVDISLLNYLHPAPWLCWGDLWLDSLGAMGGASTTWCLDAWRFHWKQVETTKASYGKSMGQLCNIFQNVKSLRLENSSFFGILKVYCTSSFVFHQDVTHLELQQGGSPWWCYWQPQFQHHAPASAASATPTRGGTGGGILDEI